METAGESEGIGELKVTELVVERGAKGFGESGTGTGSEVKGSGIDGIEYRNIESQQDSV